MGPLDQKTLLSMELWAAAKESFKLVWRCLQLLSEFLAKDHSSRVSRLSANDKGDKELIPRAVQDLLEITLRL